MRVGRRVGASCKVLSFAGLLLLAALLAAPTPARACRFWALIGEGYTEDLLTDHLRSGSINNLRQLGASHPDGWGFAWFPQDPQPLPLYRPVARRGGMRASDPGSPEFELAVEELTAIRPKAVLGHVRSCTWGLTHCGIPDPHPFQREGMIFVHNGSIAESTLVRLLTQDDPSYLVDHPPDYFRPHIDSELYFMYLLKYAHQHPEMNRVQALTSAVADLAIQTTKRLNFAMTAGDTLFALRYFAGDSGDALRYGPATGGGASPYWFVASQPVGSHSGDWLTIPERSLAVLVPGRNARFYPVNTVMGIPDAPNPATPSRANPNPMRTSIAIPIHVPPGGASVTVEVWDVQGRLIWKDGPRGCGPGEREWKWDGCGADGRPVACGSYYCKVRVGADVRTQTIRTQTITVVR